MEQRLSEASRLLSTLHPWKTRWEEERAAIHSLTLSIPGHAVLVAASVCYLCRVPADRHRLLWECWLGYNAGKVQLGCLVAETTQHTYHSHQPRVHVDPHFSTTSVLSSDEERSHWNHYASFPDELTLERCVAARQSLDKSFSPLPLVLDPHQLFQYYAHELELYHSKQYHTEGESSTMQYRGHQPSNCVEVLRVSQSGWTQTLCGLEETRERAVVLILDQAPSTSDGDLLKSLLRRRQSEKYISSDKVFRYTHSCPSLQCTYLLKPCRLYLVLEEHITNSPSRILESLGLTLLEFSVVDLQLSAKALESHLLKVTLRIDHPEYAIRHRALLVDRTFYEDQIQQCKVATLLYHTPHHIHIV